MLCACCVRVPSPALVLTCASVGLLRAGHPGLSNNFLVATGATEALLRNDQSVLEHMHSYLLFKSLRRPSCNVFAGVAADVYKAQRRMIIRCILGTDLAQHFEVSDYCA